MISAPSEPRWRGRLELEYRQDAAGRTRLTRTKHEGPLRVQRAFAQADGSCHTYILHPPGGLVGGDELAIHAAVREGGRALVTTPGAAKFYRSAGPQALQRVELHVDAGASLEWLPQESIAFAGTRTRCTTTIDLDPTARLVLWDIVCLGRPAAGEAFERGSLEQRLRVRIGGRPRWLEHARYGESSNLGRAPCGMRGLPVTGTLLCHPARPAWLDALREVVEARSGNALRGVTVVGDLLVCRYLGTHTEDARACLTAVWSAFRQLSDRSERVLPRVWAT